MRTVKSNKEMKEIEQERALVGVYVDRAYNLEKVEWLMRAREGFDLHAKHSWHLLIPVGKGYGVNSFVDPENYGAELAAGLIDRLGISFKALPCIVFRAMDEEFFYLKLGNKSRDQFFEEIGRIADLARECAANGPTDSVEFRKYVNMHVANHLRRRRLLSATRSALPVIGGLLGSAVDFSELV